MRNSIPCLGIIRIRCKGFDLSLSFNPQADKAPLLVSAAKIQLLFGYYWLDTWVMANVIQLATQDFCARNLNKSIKPQQNNTNTRKLPPPRH